MQLKFFIFIFLLYSPTTWAIERVALVIGNGDYKEVSSLTNAVNDAKDMAKTLRSLNFKVIEKHNVNRKQMAKAITQFGKKLGKDTVGLFYYAGHGLEVKGHNYLLPVNAPIETIDEVHFESIDVDRILAKMESATNGLNIMILDACRDNPFGRRGGFRTINRGLAPVNAPTGLLVVYATAPGEKAADGKGQNGLFTKYLLKNMVRPGIDVAVMLRDTRYQVMQEAQRLGFKQVPWESSSLLTPFCFAGCEPVAKSSVSSVAVTRTAVVDPPPAPPSVAPSIESVEPEMVAIEGGTFQMGCLSDDKDCQDMEKAVHKVTVSSFAMGKYEVTFDQWDACVKAKGCSYQADYVGRESGQQPVVGVSWNDTQEYVQWLKKETGKAYRLPTEAEWEYVARAGTTTKYPWGNTVSHEKANYGKDDCCGGLAKGRDKWVKTAPVGKFVAYMGVHDMHGNVSEWTCSVYERRYKGAEKQCAKRGESDVMRIVRGGNWRSGGKYIRSAARSAHSRYGSDNNIGFRLALD